MDYLLDTDAFSDLVGEHPRVIARIAAMPTEDRIAICSIVAGEVAYGIARLPQGKRRREIEAKAAKLLPTIICHPVPPSAGEHYARIKITQQKAGLSLDENDLWIAACTAAYDATLVSRDLDFARIGGLRVENWTA
ncbi:MAG TPA: type II toxin-antitoxin system VapC family toxin [Phycisphaerae bacterium]|jgi:hypothetical protein